MAPHPHTGGCLCGGVRFQADPPLREIVACHCGQCRRWSGHVWAATSVPLDRFRLTAEATLRWFASSAAARRGFCTRCGSSLWFRSAAGEFSVEAGAVAGPIGGRLAEHIFVASKGDYYSLDDGLPQSGRW